MERIEGGPPHIEGKAMVWVSPHDGSIHISSSELGFNVHVSRERQPKTWDKLAARLRLAGHAR